MTHRLGRLALLTCCTAVVLTFTLPAIGAAAPPVNGCPRGYELLSVATLTAAGYHLPAQVDDPTSGLLSYGRPGNGDGFVCGVQLGNQTTSFGGPVYNFMDDGLPA